MADSPLLEFRSHVLYNQSVSLLNEAHAFHAYHQIHRNFDTLIRICTTTRDLKGESLVSFGPFLLLMQRQGVMAYWSMAGHQSYQAWVLFRPLLEACLIIGKWVDDTANAKIWKNRDKDWMAYRDAYQGAKLESQSLPRSAKLRRVLSRINDDFIHMNHRYYSRHTEVASSTDDSVFVQVHYFDRDEADHQAHFYAFLHLVLLAQDSIARLWEKLFGDAGKVEIGLETFESHFSERIAKFLEEHPESRAVLEELGLWSFSKGT